MSLSLEQMLVSRTGFGLTTATPLQRAICRAADGLPLGELAGNEDVVRGFGGTLPEPGAIPQIVMVLAGIRGAKSTMAAARAVVSSQTCDLSKVSPGDEVRIPVLAIDKDSAGVAFSQMIGHIQARPALRRLLIGEPTTESFFLRHPSGRAIEVKVTALARAGSTLVGRWLAGAIFDEAPRMNGDESVKSLSESLRAIQGRMLPGSQIWMVGSPHAPFGPVYEMQLERFGRPGPDIVIIRAPGPAMNPVWWTPERCEEIRKRSPAAHRTDVLAEFADPEESLVSSIELEECMRRNQLHIPFDPKWSYIATMDPATRGNAWTLVVYACTGLGGETGLVPQYTVATAREWIGSKSDPLKPSRVLQEISDVLADYRVDDVITDQYAFDALRDLAEHSKLTLRSVILDSENRMKMAETLALLVSQRAIDLPDVPHLRTDILAARKRITQNGRTLVLPKSSDGRHCDYMASLMIAAANPPQVPIQETVDRVDHGEFAGIISALDGADNDPFAQYARRLTA